MSQQMHFDEEQQHSHETSYTPPLGEPVRGYDRRYVEMPAQKIATQDSASGKGNPSAGQRLALAIVSMIVLIGSTASLSGANGFSFGIIAARLVGIIVIAMATVAINLIFAWRR